MNDLSFLSNFSLPAGDQKIRVEHKKQEHIPVNGADLRVFRDGRVYPSQALVDKYNLEYQPKGAEVPGFGLDVVDSIQWAMYPKGAPRVVFVAAVSRHLPKVDLFHRTTYNEDGTPVNTVQTQGNKNIQLVESLKAVGLFANEADRFVDLRVATEYPVTSPDGIYYLPKTVERGSDKGKPTYQKRENITLYPLTQFVPNAPNAETLPATIESEEEALMDIAA